MQKKPSLKKEHYDMSALKDFEACQHENNTTTLLLDTKKNVHIPK